jgi:hypothetical protein
MRALLGGPVQWRCKFGIIIPVKQRLGLNSRLSWSGRRVVYGYRQLVRTSGEWYDEILRRYKSLLPGVEIDGVLTWISRYFNYFVFYPVKYYCVVPGSKDH